MSRTVLLRLGMRRRLHSLRFKRADEVQRGGRFLESWTHPIRLSLLAGSPGERNRRALGGSGQRARVSDKITEHHSVVGSPCAEPCTPSETRIVGYRRIRVM
ncbi:hypothetical protein CIHG_06780 [Coccidioides immitis H538.4]|uniref:Uncharacterized protein n=2 Tax=Coccidioides immitis TaxID=5501 RepID=A0A0J8RXR2_COCIT|nr:hypothetical protein CIRG_04334 [Coccidioides immitis RMSCC 2394]KMU88979.1 hypothetical protein CIHG_06780 [Coccidioides immitis H538.4]